MDHNSEYIDKSRKSLLGTTKKGKEIYTKMRSGSTLYHIEFHSGGELPAILQGDFTSIAKAQVAVDTYLAQKDEDDAKKSAR